MTFNQFKEIMNQIKPECNVHYGGTSIVFIDFPSKYPTKANNGRTKEYTYRGSYRDILNRFGITVTYRTVYEKLKSDLIKYKTTNGQYNEDFDQINEYDWIIKDLEEELKKMESGIIID